MSKTLVCRCEDVTLEELHDAIKRGNRDLESLKRYTGFGTGFCQGKSCVATCAHLLVLAGGSAGQTLLGLLLCLPLSRNSKRKCALFLVGLPV
jgi:NAD(P)H-nitrite reductase large subunit